MEAFAQEHYPEVSDLKQAYGKIFGQITNFGQDLEGMTGGRILSQQLKSEIGSYAAPGMTQEQALDKIKAQGAAYITKQQDQLLSGMSPGQKALIYQKHGIKPAFLVDAPQKNSAGHSLDIDKSIELGQPVYKAQ